MGVKATNLRKGSVIEKDGDLLLITEYTHKTPGNLRAFFQMKLKSLTTGQSTSLRASASEMFEQAYLERKNCEYLYQESNGNYVFMNSETYEQFHLPKDLAEESMLYIKENQTCEVTFHGTTPITVTLPPQVILVVKETEIAVKGNSANNVKKDAILETGLKVKVPAHVGEGEAIKINTDNGEFQGRADSE